MRFVLVLCSLLPLTASADFDRFQALIAVDDGCKGRSGEAVFRVQVDGKEVFKSGVMLPGDDPIPLDLDISGATVLGLYIDDEGDGHGGDWGEWLDARLTDTKAGESVFLTDLVPEEKAWIWANRDRNIVQEPMRVNGVLYLRGWGCISGSEMVFRDWEKAIAEHEAGLDRANAEAAKDLGALSLRTSDALPAGLTVSVDGKRVGDDALRKGVFLKADSVITVRHDLANAEHRTWWVGGGCEVSAGQRSFPLFDLVLPSERWVQSGLPLWRNAVRGATLEGRAVFLGWELPVTGSVEVAIRDIPSAIPRPAGGGPSADTKLTLSVGNGEAGDELPYFAGAKLTVLADGRPVCYGLTDGTGVGADPIGLIGLPESVEIVTHPGGDGSVGDSFVVSAVLSWDAAHGRKLDLGTMVPTYSHLRFGSLARSYEHAGWRVPGAAVVRWSGIPAEAERRQAGQAAFASEARDAIETAKTVEEVEAALDKALSADPDNFDARHTAAEKLGDIAPKRAIWHWSELSKNPRSGPPEVQEARIRARELWRVVDPADFIYPDDHSSTRDNRAKMAYPFRQQELGDGFWGNELPSYGISGMSFTLPAPEARRIGILVNSLGAELHVSCLNGETTIAETSAVNPFLDIDLAAHNVSPGEELTLMVERNPDVTGLLLEQIVYAAVWPIGSDEDLPREAWDIALNPDGSAEVSRTSRVPVLAAIPRTATDLRVENGKYTLDEPATELLVDWYQPLGAVNLPLFAVPDEGKEMRVSYHWPDAAYNVPMSKWAWGRVAHTYLRTPSSILSTKRDSTWRVTRIPDGWKPARWTPAPASEDPFTFEVVPTQGLDAEFEARDVLTSWLSMTHRNLVMYVPDNPNNRRWFPLWFDYIRLIYDKQVAVSGFEKPRALYIGVQGATQLSGYGGATIGDEHMSESWVASTGRMAPCFWRDGSNPSGVDSHELHWVHFGCFPEGMPVWVPNSFGVWLEEIGWRTTGLPGSRQIMRSHQQNVGPALELVREMGENPLQYDQEHWDALPGPTRDKMVSLGWHIANEVYETYGEDAWARLWTDQRRLYPDLYPVLSERTKQILLVDELVRITGDPKLRERFEKEWLFDLTPDSQDAPDRLLILPRNPKFSLEDRPEFAEPDFDDTSWRAAAGPGKWEAGNVAPELKGRRGTAWFRFEFVLPESFHTENAELLLGDIGAADEAYLNGRRIGSTGEFPPGEGRPGNPERVYSVPAEAIRPGERNVLAVRIYDDRAEGGIPRRPRLISRIPR